MLVRTDVVRHQLRQAQGEQAHRARNAITQVESASGLNVEMPAVFPLLSENPGAVHDRAPTLGEHTDAVLESAGLTAEQRSALRAKGVIA